MGPKPLKAADSSSEITCSKILSSCNRPYQRKVELANMGVKGVTTYVRCN